MNIIIMPAYKPNILVTELVRDIALNENQAIVVDDGSGDNYKPIFDKIKSMGGIVLSHRYNRGKGNAIKTALHYVETCFSEDDIIVTMDADGQHALKDVFHVLEEAKRNRGSLILGVRNFSFGKVPLRSMIGNIITKEVFYLGNRIRIRDTQTGLRAFSYPMLSYFNEITGSRYEYEMNMLSYCAKNRIDIIEVPIQTIYLDDNNSTSHFRIIKDSILIYKDILKFTFSSAISFLLDYVSFILLFLLFKKVPNGILLSNIFARFISAIFNYTINVKFVFRTKESDLKSILKYAVLAISILSLNNVVLLSILTIFRLPALVSKILTELVLFLLSFLIQHLFIFKRHKS